MVLAIKDDDAAASDDGAREFRFDFLLRDDDVRGGGGCLRAARGLARPQRCAEDPDATDRLSPADRAQRAFAACLRGAEPSPKPCMKACEKEEG